MNFRVFSVLFFYICLFLRHEVHSFDKEISSVPRANQVSSVKSLFQNQEILHLQIKSDFAKIYAISQSQDFIDSEDKNLDAFFTSASIVNQADTARVINAKIRPRGNSSLDVDEASFPKMRLEIEKQEELKGTIFQGSRNLRINTHLNTEFKNTHTPMGRLNGENSPRREGLCYEMARVLEIASPSTRLANVKYIDSVHGLEFTRHALLIETDKKMAERLKMTPLDPLLFANEESPNIEPIVGAKFLLFHKMIGNDDVALRISEPVAPNMNGSYRALYNTTLLKDSAGRIVPTVYDFDVSTFVSGYDLVSSGLYQNSYFNLNKHESSMFVVKFLSLRQKFKHEHLLSAVDFFKEKKDELYKTVRQSSVDSEGKKNALLHLDTFFQNVDYAMGLKVIAQEQLPLYKDLIHKKSKLRQDPISGELDDPGYLRPGTPVIVLGQEGGFLKVAILDINFDLVADEQPVGYIPATAIISNQLPENFVGRIDNRDLLR